MNITFELPADDMLDQLAAEQQLTSEQAAHDHSQKNAEYLANSSREKLIAQCPYLGMLAIKSPEAVDRLLNLAEAQPIANQHQQPEKAQAAAAKVETAPLFAQKVDKPIAVPAPRQPETTNHNRPAWNDDQIHQIQQATELTNIVKEPEIAPARTVAETVELPTLPTQSPNQQRPKKAQRTNARPITSQADGSLLRLQPSPKPKHNKRKPADLRSPVAVKKEMPAAPRTEAQLATKPAVAIKIETSSVSAVELAADYPVDILSPTLEFDEAPAEIPVLPEAADDFSLRSDVPPAIDTTRETIPTLLSSAPELLNDTPPLAAETTLKPDSLRQAAHNVDQLLANLPAAESLPAADLAEELIAAAPIELWREVLQLPPDEQAEVVATKTALIAFLQQSSPAELAAELWRVADYRDHAFRMELNPSQSAQVSHSSADNIKQRFAKLLVLLMSQPLTV